MGKKKTNKEVEKILLEFLTKQNRPYNAKMVFEAIDGKENGISQNTVQLVLDDMTAEGTIMSKTFKKITMYWPNQAGLPELSKDELEKLDTEISDLQSEVDDLESAAKRKQQTVASIESEPTDEELDTAIAAIISEHAKVSEKVATIKERGVAFSEADKVKAEKKYKNNRDQWRKRKRICMEIKSTFEENMGSKKFKTIIDDIGFETDDSFGVKMDEDKTTKILKEQGKLIK